MTDGNLYEVLARKFLGRPPGRGDSTPESHLLAAEKRLGVHLPVSLRSYHRVAGRAKELNDVHNVLRSPDRIALEGGYLVFMDENQGVVSWGLRESDLAKPDPVVWQRNNTPPEAWFSERKRLFPFLTSMFAWYESVGILCVRPRKCSRRTGLSSGSSGSSTLAEWSSETTACPCRGHRAHDVGGPNLLAAKPSETPVPQAI